MTIFWTIIAIIWPISIILLFFMFATSHVIDKDSDILDEDEKLNFKK